MKRTKSMIYEETTESRELELYATNHGDLYRSMISPYIKSLKRKFNKSSYEKEKAIDGFYRIATAASNLYNRDFGYTFTVKDRFTAAVNMESYYFESEVLYNE